MFADIQFADKHFLLLLVLIPAMVVWYWFRNGKRHADIQLASTEGLEITGKSLKQSLFHGLFVLRMIAVSLFIIALARPQSSLSRRDVSVEGIDIAMAFDISTSMLARDFSPNRIEAAKIVAKEFITERPDDRIGLIVFSGETFTQCPLTTDHNVLINLFESINAGMIEDGTAIGDGVATAVDRLKNSTAISKVIILITDGVNNRGKIDPLSAAEIAKIFGIRVYTIGVGSLGQAKVPVAMTPDGKYIYDYRPVEIDEEVLTKIADITNGQYFRATSKNKLQEIYAEIDQLEKTKIDVSEYQKKKEEFFLFALLGLILLIIEIIFRNTIFRTLP
ncbi:VWA domain-containing protein [candidate division KSB1 bacterium]